MDALPQLHEAEPVEPDVRDVAPGGLVEQRLRRRPEREPLGEPDELLELRHEVEGDGGSLGATRWLTSPTAALPASIPTCSSRYSKITL